MATVLRFAVLTSETRGPGGKLRLAISSELLGDLNALASMDPIALAVVARITHKLAADCRKTEGETE